jgi:DivIVA domain-containing protein
VTWVLWTLPLLVVAGSAVIAAGWVTTGMAPAYDDRPDVLVPGDRPLAGDDVRSVRFTTAFRGYRMAEVDALLDRLAAQIDEQDGPANRRPGLQAPDVTGGDRAG